MNDYSKYTQSNRLAWNAAISYHRKAKESEWDELFADPKHIEQEEPELSALLDLGISGKSIVHLCCNNGLELLSLKRLEAGKAVGFDISDEAIKDARIRAKKFGIDADFYQCDVYQIPESFSGLFDLVYITIGAFCWLPDLNAFFKVAARLLKKQGSIFIYESHPFAQVLPYDVHGTTDKPVIENNYFLEGYQKYDDGIDYYGGVSYKGPATYEFTHTLSDIITAILDNILQITCFKEYHHDISKELGWVEKTGLRLPLSYILTAKKQ
jgi:SAM-dependent methyltransferase